MYNIYKNGIKVAETIDKKLTLDDLSEGSYEFGVAEVINGVEGFVEVVNVTVDKKLEEVATDDTEQVVDIEDYHTGAGWYKFDDGHKVRGKEAAEEYLESIK